jgi:hypothetical protein
LKSNGQSGQYLLYLSFALLFFVGQALDHETRRIPWE